jgi:hypothetical protein
MSTQDLQSLCELGQQQLMRTEYLAAEATLAGAEAEAWERKDFDTLSRLYMPLQEARRQRRQKCSEGVVCLDILQRSPEDALDPKQIVAQFPNGHLLVAGWGTLAPAMEVRRLQGERRLYAETILACVYPAAGSFSIAIQPFPDPGPKAAPAGQHLIPVQDHSIILHESGLPRGAGPATAESCGQVMALWEMLSDPFMRAADAEMDPLKKIELYRKAILADYACELAHQKLADAAKELAKGG